MSTGRRYRVVRSLGRGPRGIVYRAAELRGRDVRREVALKLLNTKGDAAEDLVRRLRVDLVRLRQLHHAQVGRPEAVVHLSGHWALVSRHFECAPVARLTADGALSSAQTFALLGRAARCLLDVADTPDPYGRPLSLAHGNLKPGNIGLAADGAVYLLDFGVPPQVSSADAAYRPPEVPHRQPRSTSDVYALGTIALLLLAGSPPPRPGRDPASHAKAFEAYLAAFPEEVGDLLQALVAFEPPARPSLEEVAERFTAHGGMSEEAFVAWAAEAVPRALAEPVATDPLEGHVVEEQPSPDDEPDSATSFDDATGVYPIGTLARRFEQTTDQFDDGSDAEAGVVEDAETVEEDADPLGALLAEVRTRQSLAPMPAFVEEEESQARPPVTSPPPAPRVRSGRGAAALGLSFLVGIGIAGLMFVVGVGVLWAVSG